MSYLGLLTTLLFVFAASWSSTEAQSCTLVDTCTCDMSDGSGRINLHSLALKGVFLQDTAFSELASDGWYYHYNPCNPFSMYIYSGLSLFQSSDEGGSYGFDLGAQSTADFQYNTDQGLSIHYDSSDVARTSRVLLVCDMSKVQPEFKFIGEPIPTEYDFTLTSQCACPGVCNEDGAIVPPTTLPPPPPCNFVDSCTCDMSDGSGQVNLKSLAKDGGTLTNVAFSIDGGDGWLYKYNPCNGFQISTLTDLAIAQADSATETSGYDLGVQSKTTFSNSNSDGLSIYYESADSVRTSRVRLICQSDMLYHNLEFIGELTILEYDFILTSTCACPGLCDDNGPTVTLPTPPPVGEGVTCNFIDTCTCEMSDGSGRINLHGPALEGPYLYNAAFNVVGSDGWYYMYNPCDAFNQGVYTDLAIYQAPDQLATWGYELGTQSSASFDYTEATGLSIHYASTGATRTSRVLLQCQTGSNDHVFEFLGELVITEYDFLLTTPCACPGLCDDDGIINPLPTPPIDTGDVSCNFIDSCTCEMSDGTGRVNLHGPALEGNLNLYDSAFTVDGSDGWRYKYNPCNGFSASTYTDLAVYQTDTFESYGFDLGVQSNTSFIYTTTEGLAIHYTSADNKRKSRVLLVCESAVDDNQFIFVGELIITEYEFILSSPCACPGYCNDDGLISPLPTPPDAGSDGTCNFIDSCTCEMSDGTGTVNLKALALYDPWYLYDSAFTEYGSDGYYYKYNPCYGFYFNGYYDTAIAQTYDTWGTYGTELGTQASAYFSNTDGSGLTIQYKSTYEYSTARVLLVCEANTDEHRFSYIGQLANFEYEFMLTTPCACPGACDDFGVINPPVTDTYCSKVDSCTCEMGDGSGQINLKSLALQGDALYESAFTYDGLDGWLYKYNPCNPFSLSYFYDLALAQSNGAGTSGHDLGVQDSAKFEYSVGSGLAIHYTSSDKIRESKVLLVCDPAATNAEFQFVGELVTLEYEFILKSACACAGGCDDDGVLNPGNPGGGNGGGVVIPDNINVNVNGDDSGSSTLWTYVGGSTIALLFHDIVLVLLIAAIVIIVKKTMWCDSTSEEQGQSSVRYENIKAAVRGQNAV